MYKLNIVRDYVYEISDYVALKDCHHTYTTIQDDTVMRGLKSQLILHKRR